jgi:hypothetical protein
MLFEAQGFIEPLQCQLVGLLTEIYCLPSGHDHETRLKLPSVLVFVSRTHPTHLCHHLINPIPVLTVASSRTLNFVDSPLQVNAVVFSF